MVRCSLRAVAKSTEFNEFRLITWSVSEGLFFERYDDFLIREAVNGAHATSSTWPYCCGGRD